MPHAQMPEPVPEFEHQPVEEPPSSTPPIEDPPPGEPAPTSPIPDRLSATGPEPRAARQACWSGGHGGQADVRTIAGGRDDIQTRAAPLRGPRGGVRMALKAQGAAAMLSPSQVATITLHRWREVRSRLAAAGLATALLVACVAIAHSQPPPVPAIPPDAQPAPPAEITPSHPANGRPAPGVPGPARPAARQATALLARPIRWLPEHQEHPHPACPRRRASSPLARRAGIQPWRRSERTHRLPEAVVDGVLDQGLLGLRDRFLDGAQLLSDVGATVQPRAFRQCCADALQRASTALRFQDDSREARAFRASSGLIRSSDPRLSRSRATPRTTASPRAA